MCIYPLKPLITDSRVSGGEQPLIKKVEVGKTYHICVTGA